MATPKTRPEISISNIIKYLITLFHWTSPYKWIDYTLEQKEKKSHCPEKIKTLRYRISEIYILGWLGLSIMFLLIHQLIPLPFIYFLMLRVVGILNKELGVVLFGTSKITKGNNVSHHARVIILAFVNYLTVGLLFALLYTKIGIYEFSVSALSLKQAVLQSLSILFSFAPTYDPKDLFTKYVIVAESGFCFIFAILIISTFIGLIQLNSDTTKT